MTELKTLKDIKVFVTVESMPVLENYRLILRQEAIKRAKYTIEEQKQDRLYTAWWFVHQGRLEEIREFFNLTEEDLK